MNPMFQKAVQEIPANRKLRKLWQNKLGERESPKRKMEGSVPVGRMGLKNWPTGSRKSSGRWDNTSKKKVELE